MEQENKEQEKQVAEVPTEKPAGIKQEVEKKTEPKVEPKPAPVKKTKQGPVTLVVGEKEFKKMNNVVKSLNGLVEEATFKVTSEGLNVLSMDAANVAMIVWKFSAKNFLQYTETNVEFRVNIKQLQAAFKRFDKGTVEFTIGDNLKMKNVSKNTKGFTIPLIVDEEKAQKVPELKPTSSLTMDTVDFEDMIKDAAVFEEAVTFKSRSGRFRCKSKGDTTGSLHDFNNVITTGTDATSKYAILYLKKMIISSFKEVSIKFANDYPALIEYTEDNNSILFIIAPRCETEWGNKNGKP